MNLRGAIAVLAIVAGVPGVAHAEITTPVSFNVKVKVSGLTDDVESVGVKCAIMSNDRKKYAVGEGQAPVASGGFDGVVTVPIGGAYTPESLAVLVHPLWECDLFMISKNGSELFAGTAGNPVWAQAAANAPIANAITGPFPPDKDTTIQSINPETLNPR
jgi:hypothetical protein